MKPFKAVAFILTLLGTYCSLKAQCFEKKDKIISTGIKLGIYNSMSNYADNSQPDDHGRAASLMYPITFEYAVNNKIGAGVDFVYNNYITTTDSSSGNTPSAFGLDFQAAGYFHFVNTDHTDLYAKLGIGYSNFIYQVNDSLKSQYKAGGLGWKFQLGSRFYVGKHLGLMFNVGYASYAFNNGTVSNNDGYNKKMSFILNGTNWGLGLSVRF